METDKLTSRKLSIVSVLFVSAILMTATLANSSAFAAKQVPLDGDVREAKFNQLYQNDVEFKQIVDAYREISTKEEALAQADWDQLKTLFDNINTKMDGKALTEEEWKNYMPLFKEAIISKRAITELKSQPSNEVTGAASTSLLTLVDTDYMPRLYQPTIDINGGSHGSHTHSGGNGFQKYYVKTFDETVYGYTLTGKMIYEVTLVFADEDCFTFGSNWCDSSYDNQRLSDWGRIKDLESFFIVVTKSTGNVDHLSFIKITLNKVGGGSKTADGAYTYIKHFDDSDHNVEKDYSWTYYTGKHMKIWANTWNHAMTDVDTNSDLSDTGFSVWTYTKNSGARWQVENAESTIDYSSQSLPLSP